jgi:hypothetical protein
MNWKRILDTVSLIGIFLILITISKQLYNVSLYLCIGFIIVSMFVFLYLVSSELKN